MRDRVRLYALPDFAAGTVPEAALQAIGEGFDAFKAGQEEMPDPFDPFKMAEVEIDKFRRLLQVIPIGFSCIRMLADSSLEQAGNMADIRVR